MRYPSLPLSLSLPLSHSYSLSPSLSPSLPAALNTDNILLKIQIFLILSAISKHSREGLAATLQALDYYKVSTTLQLPPIGSHVDEGIPCGLGECYQMHLWDFG